LKKENNTGDQGTQGV